MGREWRNGDLARWTNGDESGLAFRTGLSTNPGWEMVVDGMDSKRWSSDENERYTTFHPLVVIDPEDREQVERLAIAYTVIASARSGDEYRAWENRSKEARARIRTELAAALREFANPTPPKPDEPTGLGVLVTASYEDGDGKGFGPATWARGGDGTWVCLTDGMVGHVVPWPFLQDVEVTS